jgi:hypothetical protein
MPDNLLALGEQTGASTSPEHDRQKHLDFEESLRPRLTSTFRVIRAALVAQIIVTQRHCFVKLKGPENNPIMRHSYKKRL